MFTALNLIFFSYTSRRKNCLDPQGPVTQQSCWIGSLFKELQLEEKSTTDGRG